METHTDLSRTNSPSNYRATSMSGGRQGSSQNLRRVFGLFLLLACTTILLDAFLVLPSTSSSSLARARASSPRQRLRMQDSYLTSLEETSSSSSSSSTASSPVAVGGGKEKKKVVVIGAGWGGLSAAYELAKRCV